MQGHQNTLVSGGRTFQVVDITAVPGLHRLPLCLRVLLENALRTCPPEDTDAVIEAFAGWSEGHIGGVEVPFSPARVLMQDMAGAPVLYDLVSMRDALARLSGDPRLVNPQVPVDLVVDHSVIVDHAGRPDALALNTRIELDRNAERYGFLRWAQEAFENFRVVPPGTGIVHQVNIEFLTQGVMTRETGGTPLIYPDTCVGTDSHTTMVNGLGVVGWGVGGIEAMAAMLGQPTSVLLPQVVGVELVGQLPRSSTATDLVLALTETLRGHGVVGTMVEFFGAGLGSLPVPHRATVANMSPEFGSTVAYFPVDDRTLEYYAQTGRRPEQIQLIEDYTRAQGLWSLSGAERPEYSQTLSVDLSAVRPSISGPSRPQDRIDLRSAKEAFRDNLESAAGPETGAPSATTIEIDSVSHSLHHGAVAVAAITSCTNTSNPEAMVTAGLLARNVVARGLKVPAWVKTSLAPGSPVVTRYLADAGLMEPLERLGFQVVGYGCTTCMGNSGPLLEGVSRAAHEEGLLLTSVLSGNRNFEGRINPDVSMNYLMSPPLVVAYAVAGTLDHDMYTDPLGRDSAGEPVHLHDVWPTPEEIESLIGTVDRDMFIDGYRSVFAGPDAWRRLDVPQGDLFPFDPDSTYLRRAPFLDQTKPTPDPVTDIVGARVLVMLGDSVTTDHISPVGSIPATSAAGRYLDEAGVARRDFNSYGSRRGNHEVMVRGTFANVRLRNQLVPGISGGITRHLPSDETLPIYDAAMRYAREGTPLIVLGGREYGSGSARDYAAKGTLLLGVRAVLAESYERIHRSNLVGMGIVPLQYVDGDSAEGLGLDGTEQFDVIGLAEFESSRPDTVLVVATRDDGTHTEFTAQVRVDSSGEAEYIRHGGILSYVLRTLLSRSRSV